MFIFRVAGCIYFMFVDGELDEFFPCLTSLELWASIFNWTYTFLLWICSHHQGIHLCQGSEKQYGISMKSLNIGKFKDDSPTGEILLKYHCPENIREREEAQLCCHSS